MNTKNIVISFQISNSFSHLFNSQKLAWVFWNQSCYNFIEFISSKVLWKDILKNNNKSKLNLKINNIN